MANLAQTLDKLTVEGELCESLADDAKVFLVNIQKNSPRYKERYPFYAAWQAKATQYLPGNLLKILPYQGKPLAPNTMHALVVLKSLGSKDGSELIAAYGLKRWQEAKCLKASMVRSMPMHFSICGTIATPLGSIGIRLQRRRFFVPEISYRR